MAATGIHISLVAEPIFHIGTFAITNSMFTSVLVSAILIGFAFMVRSQLSFTNKPTGLQNFAEWLVESLYNFVHSITGDHHKTRTFLPVISSFFLFILLNNWIGLMPGVGTITVPESHAPASIEQYSYIPSLTAYAASPATNGYGSTAKEAVMVPLLRPGTADLNTTLALALISVFLTQVYGLQFAKLGYLAKFFNFSSPIMFFVGILELISEFAKIVSFAFRLFGNIFAGEVLLVVISYLLAVVVPMPFYGLELFVGFIQALVFSMLSLVFFNMATQSHEH